MRLNRLFIIIGIAITAISLVLFFLFGEFWLSPILIVIPYCFSKSRFRNENTNNSPESNEESNGETVPYVDIEMEISGEKVKRCSRCRAPIKEENLRFCPKCGNKLNFSA